MRDLLRGERVRLATLSDDDVPELRRWREDGEFLRLFDAVPAVPKSEAQLRAWLQEAANRADSFLFGVRRVEDDRLVGQLELDGILWPHGASWISVAIGHAEDRGKGYGGEAIQLALRFAFDELNLHRVQLTVFAYNTRAIALYERLGFTREGVYREFLQRDGQRWDMLLYGMLRGEWTRGE